MKKNCRHFFAVLLLLIAVQLHASQTRILSIGNSLINSNTQPALFQALAQAGGRDAQWTECCLLGQSLLNHWELGLGTTPEGLPSARTLIQQGGWTHVILQDYSNRPLVDREGFFASVRQFAAEIRAYCPDAAIVLFENWPYNDSPDYARDLSLLNAAYAEIACETNAFVAPIGCAFDAVRRLDTFAKMDPYVAIAGDNKHPSLTGSCLSAAVIYFTLFDKPKRPVRWELSSLTRKETRLLQRRALLALRRYRAETKAR